MDKNFLEDILKKLKSKGADHADVIFSQEESKSSSCRLGKIEKSETSEVKEIGIRVILKKKQSIISSTNLELKNLNELIDRVLEMVKVVPEDKYCGLADENQVSIPDPAEVKKLNLFDEYEPDLKKFLKKLLLLKTVH